MFNCSRWSDQFPFQILILEWKWRFSLLISRHGKFNNDYLDLMHFVFSSPVLLWWSCCRGVVWGQFWRTFKFTLVDHPDGVFEDYGGAVIQGGFRAAHGVQTCQWQIWGTCGEEWLGKLRRQATKSAVCVAVAYQKQMVRISDLVCSL